MALHGSTGEQPVGCGYGVVSRETSRSWASISRQKSRPLLVGIALAGQLLLSCGYQPVYSGRPPSQGLAVALAGPHIASLEAAAQIGAGLREGLAAGHALAPGQGYPRVEFEVLRIDERATGIAQGGAEADPLGRGLAVAVVARAWVVERAGGPRLRDTGDVRRVRRLANAASLPRARADYETLVRAAARATGRALAARILGEPIATDQSR